MIKETRFGASHASSSREYGNMAYSYGEAHEVWANIQRFALAAGFDVQNLVTMVPIHKVNIEVVDKTHTQKAGDPDAGIPFTDGLITVEKDVVLGLKAADCPGVIFASKDNKVISLVHVGRDGTDAGICAATFTKLHELGFKDPTDFFIMMSPGALCYQQLYIQTHNPEGWLPHIRVSRSEINKAKVLVDPVNTEGPTLYKIHSSTPGVQLYVDFIGYNVEQLVKLGVRREDIEKPEVCTRCTSDKWFSHSMVAETKNSANPHPEGRTLVTAWMSSKS